MLLTAGNTVCSKRKDFNRPRSISQFSLSPRGCLVKTRTRLPIVPMSQSWVYPSLFPFSHGRIRWHPTAPPPFWLVPITTSLVSILLLHHSDYDHRPSRLASRRMVLHYLCVLLECFANTVAPFGLPRTSIIPSLVSPALYSRGNCFSGYGFVCFLFFLCSDDHAMGFPDSSCLFFDLISFL